MSRSLALFVMAMLAGLPGCGPGQLERVPNRAPEVSQITVTPSEIAAGDRAALSVTATDPDQNELTFTWQVSEGEIEGSESAVAWYAPPQSGTYEIKLTVSDGFSNGVVERSASILVKSDGNGDPTPEAGASPSPTPGSGATPTPTPDSGTTPTPTPGSGATPAPVPTPTPTPTPAPPNQAPVIVQVTANPTSIKYGATSSLLANAFDNDDDPLSYKWSTQKGSVSGTGASATYTAVTGGCCPEEVVVQVVVDDGRGGSATGSVTLTVAP